MLCYRTWGDYESSQLWLRWRHAEPPPEVPNSAWLSEWNPPFSVLNAEMPMCPAIWGQGQEMPFAVGNSRLTWAMGTGKLSVGDNINRQILEKTSTFKKVESMGFFFHLEIMNQALLCKYSLHRNWWCFIVFVFVFLGESIYDHCSLFILSFIFSQKLIKSGENLWYSAVNARMTRRKWQDVINLLEFLVLRVI